MARQVPVVGSQSRAVPSLEVAASRAPSGKNAATAGPADAAQQQVHRRQPCGVFHQLDATDAAGTQVLRVLGGELVTVVIPDVLVRGTKTDEPGPTARSRTWENVSLWPLW